MDGGPSMAGFQSPGGLSLHWSSGLEASALGPANAWGLGGTTSSYDNGVGNGMVGPLALPMAPSPAGLVELRNGEAAAEAAYIAGIEMQMPFVSCTGAQAPASCAPAWQGSVPPVDALAGGLLLELGSSNGQGQRNAEVGARIDVQGGPRISGLPDVSTDLQKMKVDRLVAAGFDGQGTPSTSSAPPYPLHGPGCWVDGLVPGLPSSAGRQNRSQQAKQPEEIRIQASTEC
jgi:hypothetical protein